MSEKPAPWRPYTVPGDYDKEFTDVLLPTGEIVEACWPNAGKFARTHGHGPGVPEFYTVDDQIQIRPALSPYPWRRDKEPSGQD